MLKRAVVVNAMEDEGNIPRQQLTYNGSPAMVEIINPYGMHSSLPNNGTVACTVFAVGANEDHRVAMGYTPKIRPKPLEESELVIYHPPTQSKIHFKANGDMLIESTDQISDGGTISVFTAKDMRIFVGKDGATVKGDFLLGATGDIDFTSEGTVKIVAPNIEIEGDVKITGSLEVTENSTAADHISDGISGKTHTHGGVTTGAGSTGAPE